MTSITMHKSRLRRSIDHVVAGMSLSMPLNMAAVYIASSVLQSPAVIAVSTTVFATVLSGVRTYYVLAYHERS